MDDGEDDAGNDEICVAFVALSSSLPNSDIRSPQISQHVIISSRSRRLPSVLPSLRLRARAVSYTDHNDLLQFTMILLEVCSKKCSEYLTLLNAFLFSLTTTSSKQPSPTNSQSTFNPSFKQHHPSSILTVFTSSRPSSLDVQFVDFDGVRFHLSTPDRKTALLLSMNIRCWDELLQYGVHDVLQREYGPMLRSQAEPEYNVSLDIDLEQFPPEGGEFFGDHHVPLPRLTLSFPLRRTRNFNKEHRPHQAPCPCCAV